MKLSKKLLSLLLCAVMVLGSVAVGGNGFAEVFDAFSVKASAAKVTSYKTGDIIEFGWYPQSKETNKSITDALTSSAGNTLGWNSYNYYSGTGVWYDGQMTPSNYMRYTDIMYGSTKYRGVVFDSYRPYGTGYTSSNNEQQSNGYYTGTVYWFKYEPIKWRVLDPATGMVMAETILDSQEFNNYILGSGYDEYGYDAYWGDFSKTYYANNYEKSSIREWLNSDFYNTAFSPAQQNIIHLTGLDNSAYSASYLAYNSATTSDKIYLLSWNDALNTSYGFSSSYSTYDTSRRAKGTDYAKCQGLYIFNDGSEYDGNSWWWLRSPGYYSISTCFVFIDGYAYDNFFTNCTGLGVRPALNFNLSSDIFQSDVKDTGTAAGSGTGSNDGWADSTHIRFGSYPQTDVTTSMGSTLDAKARGWRSYKYYEGTLSYGKMHESDYMMYCDVKYGGSKYRGVKFNTYRPYSTVGASTSSCSSTYQDDNGYTIGNTYWFRYEPLVWRVLGTEKDGTIVMSENIIDSQAFNNYVLSADGEYWGDSGKTYYANNYSKSSLRDWLKNDFYSTAFSSTQQSKIMERECDNSCCFSSYPEYNSNPLKTNDKVFLLSYDEVKNTKYGFNSDQFECDTARSAKGTDYAKCQGLYVYKSSGNEYVGNFWWWLRSPYISSFDACVVDPSCGCCNYGLVSHASYGVRPAIKLNLSSDYAGSEIGSGDSIELLNVPFYVSRNRSVTLDTSWSNADFEKDNSQYNHTLAVNSLLLSKATETSEFRAKEIYSDYFGFSNIRSVDYATDDLFSPAVTFASKEANGSLIVSMAIRGSTTTGDWATDALSQVILKDGFLTTINKETDVLAWYIDDINNFYGNKYNWQNIKIHITGHSYGAAVAEGVAMGIVNKGASARNVYAYTFASPNVAEIKNSTDNPGLFNIINVNDAVPYVPVNAGYSHYGKTLYYTSNDSRNTAAFNKMFSNFDGLNVIEEHSLATYLAMMITTAPSGSVNPYTLNDLNSASIVSYKQTHTVDASVYNGYSAKYLNGAGSALYNAEKTDFCVPGLTENMIPQAIAHMKYGGKNWILIGAYDEKGVQPGVIYALDYNTGEFVAQFNVYNHDGSKNLGHMGGIAVSDYNLYISDSIPGEGSSIGYIPLDELLVDKYAKKNITIVEDFYIGDQMNNTYPAFLSFSKDSSGNRILWTGNFYNKLYSEANYQTPADSVCNSLVIGFNLIGSNSENEFRELKNYGKQANRKYVLRIPDAYHSIQGMAYSNGVVYLSCTPFKVASLGSALLTSAIYAFNVDLSTTGVKNIREGNVAGIKNITGGENIFIENGYMYGVYESAAPSYTNVTGLKSDVVWKTDVKKMLKGTNIHILNCPVDVEVTEKTTGDVVGRITNNIIDEEIAAKENAVVMATDGDTKMFWLSDPENYEIKVTGNGTGVLDYTVKSFDEEAAETGRVNYFEIPVTTNTLLTGNFVSTDETVTAADYILSGEEIITPDEVIEGSEETFAVNISCGEGGSATESFQAVSGDYVDVCATPDQGYLFEGWYDADDKLVSSEPDYRFCVRADITLKAKFSKAVTITIKTNGHGTATESFTCKAGEVFTINAIPDEGYSFVAWTDEYGMFSFSQEKKYSSLEDKEFTAYFSSKFEYSVSQITDFTVSDLNNTQIAACKNGEFTTERPDIKYTTKDGSMFITSKTPVEIQGTCDAGSDIICSIKVYSDGEEVSMYLKNISAISSDDEPGTGQKYYGFAPNGYVEYMIESDGTASLLNMCTMKDVYTSCYRVFCTDKEIGKTTNDNFKYGDNVNMTSVNGDAYWFKRFTDYDGNIKYSFVHYGKNYQITVDDTEFYYRNGMFLADYEVFPYKLTISGYTPSITVGYKSTVYLMPDMSINFNILTENMEYVWYVNGKKATAENDEMLLCLKELTNDTEVQFKLINADGSVAYESPVETIKVKHGFFDKIIAFFKKLFGSLPVIYQGDVKRYFFDD